MESVTAGPGILGGDVAGHDEDARADDGPDAEKDEVPRAEDPLQARGLGGRFPGQLVQGFLGQEGVELHWGPILI